MNKNTKYKPLINVNDLGVNKKQSKPKLNKVLNIIVLGLICVFFILIEVF